MFIFDIKNPFPYCKMISINRNILTVHSIDSVVMMLMDRRRYIQMNKNQQFHINCLADTIIFLDKNPPLSNNGRQHNIGSHNFIFFLNNLLKYFYAIKFAIIKLPPSLVPCTSSTHRLHIFAAAQDTSSVL